MTQPNIVWLTIESTRYDHTSFSEYDRDTTPNLARLAKEGEYQTHDHCITHGIWTQPSTTSIFTGTVPGRHGVGMFNETVPQELDMVQELLSDVGYRTYCMSTSPYTKAVGQDRGFDDFRHSLGPGSNLKKIVNYPRAFSRHFRDLLLSLGNVSVSGYKEGAISHMAIDNLRDMVRDGARRDQPFFVYSHLSSPHQPYDPPVHEVDAFTDEIDASSDEARGTALDIYSDLETIRRHIAEGCDFSAETWEQIIAMYDAEIRFMDRYVGNYLEWLDTYDIENLVVVMTADHGDLFGERGVIAHKFLLHDGLIRVPLLVKGFDVDLYEIDVVQHIDVMQRILYRAGADTSQFQGVSLGEKTRERAFTQRKSWPMEDFTIYEDAVLDRIRHHDWTTAVRTREYKYVVSDDCEELLALPDEETDVSDEHLNCRRELQAAIEQFNTAYSDSIESGGKQVMTDNMKKQLEYLGYR